MHSSNPCHSLKVKKGGKMTKSADFLLTQKEIKKMEMYAERIYNTAVVLDYFCRTQQEKEELSNITPIVQTLRQNADSLNAMFINLNL